MFGRKKDDEEMKASENAPAIGDVEMDDTATAPLKPFAKRASQAPAMPAGSAFRNEIPPRRGVDLSMGGRRYDRPSESGNEGKKLIVGRDIELAGEITACDRLVVEGKVTADLTDAGAIDVAPTGVFRGSAEVDEADISGLFDGTLVVRRKLTIRSTGRVRGSVRYARLVVELGGEVQGTIEVIADEAEAELRQLSAPPALVPGA